MFLLPGTKTQTKEWPCVLCTFLNKADRTDCEMCATSKDHPPPQTQPRRNAFFSTEKSNKIIANKYLTGIIREIKIVDQFKDKQLQSLINKHDTCSAICGYLSCAIPQYLLSVYTFPFHQTYRNMDKAQEKKENIYDTIIEKLCDSNELNSYVSQAMDYIIADRTKYIQNNSKLFKNTKETKDYRKAWVANYEISKYIQTMDCENKKYIAFLRCNQFREIDIANREEKELILKEEKPFGENVRFLIELFEPRVLIKCDNNCEQFMEECTKRDIEPQQVLWILDLHGHYNCAFSTVVNDRNNIVIMDTYLANHCSNPAAVQCFNLVFRGNMNAVTCVCGLELECIQAKEAYEKCDIVYCDGCNAKLVEVTVYHCTEQNTAQHKDGFDLCLKCANK